MGYPYEPDEHESDEPTPSSMSVSVQVPTVSADQIAYAAALQILEPHGRRGEIADKLHDKIDEAIGEAIDKRLGSAFADLAKQEIDRVVAGGWKVMNEYGREVGTETLREHMLKHLKATAGYSGQSNLTTWVKEAIERQVKVALGEEAKRAREAMRQEVDELIRAKLAETLRKALGLA